MGRLLTQAEADRIVALRARGWSWPMIGERLGRSVSFLVENFGHLARPRVVIPTTIEDALRENPLLSRVELGDPDELDDEERDDNDD